MEETIIFNNFGHNYVTKYWQKKHQYTKSNRFYYINSGTGSFSINGKVKLFEIGKLYFIPPSIDFETLYDQSNPLLHTYCDFELFPPLPFNNILTYTPNKLEYSILEVFTLLCKKNLQSKKFNPYNFLNDNELSLFNSILKYFLNNFRETINNNPLANDQIILKSLQYIHDNISKKITLKELSDYVYMSESGLIKKFRKILGITPYAYLKKFRLYSAIQLQKLGYSLETIAEQLGYSDASSLAHAKKKL